MKEIDSEIKRLEEKFNDELTIGPKQLKEENEETKKKLE